MIMLPVFATIATAYRFLFHKFWLILRLSWLPLLIVTGAQYFSDRTDSSTAGPFEDLILQIALSCVQAIGYSVVAVALHRIILFGERKDRANELSLGRVELLFVLAPIAVFLIVVVGIGVPFAGVVGIAIALGFAEALNAIGAILVLIFFFLSLYLFVRLMLLYPLAVILKRLAFSQSWIISRDNFWRLLGVMFLGSLPFFIAALVVEIPILRSHGFFSKLTVEGVRRLREDLAEAMVAFNYIASLVGLPLGVALLCYSFKALAGFAPDENIIEDRAVTPGTTGLPS